MYNNNSTSFKDVIVLCYARESCLLGRRKSFFRKQVALFFFFKTENRCEAKRVVVLNRNPTIGTQEEYEIPPNSGSR